LLFSVFWSIILVEMTFIDKGVLVMIRLGFLILLVACLLSGCSKSVNYAPTGPLCIVTPKANAMEIAQQTLISMGFTIEKFDVEYGFIKTRPLRAGQFFEFWRRDNVGSENTKYANIHSVQRTIELDVSVDRNKVCMECNAAVRRLSIPEKEIISISQAGELYTGGNQARRSLKLNAKQKEDMAWIDLEDDYALEAYILKKIDKKVAKLSGKEQ
jgi:hypothetical protein